MDSSESSETVDDGVKIVRTTSTFDCGGRCPIKLHVKDNKILDICWNDDLTYYNGTNKEIIECQGKAVVPGFDDARFQSHSFAVSLPGVDCKLQHLKRE